MKSLIEMTGPLIDDIGSEIFAKTLSDTLKTITPFDYTVIFSYLGTARPLDLFDNFPNGSIGTYFASCFEEIQIWWN